VTDFGIRQDIAVHVKDDWIEKRSSPRAASMRSVHVAYRFLDDWAAGLVSPLGELDQLPLVQVDESLQAPLEIEVRFGLTIRFVSPLTSAPCRKTVEFPSGPRTEHRGRTRERRPAPLESETTSETGSFRRRAPVAAYFELGASRERLTVGSGHAFFRVHSDEADSSGSE
jgi:hypothetical protein